MAEFEAQCEFIQARWTNANYIGATDADSDTAIRNDYAMVSIQVVNHPSGLGQGAWMAMSSINSAATLESKTAVSHGYPGRRPDLSDNVDSVYFLAGSSEWIVNGVDQYHTHGGVDSETTSARLATKLESGPGQSGAAAFYYTDDDTEYTGQAHYIIGVVTHLVADWSGSTNNDTVDGPTVGQFRDWATGLLP